MSFSDPRRLRDRLVAAAPTLLVQGAVGYALLTGLAVTVFAPPQKTLTTKNVPLPAVPPPDAIKETPPTRPAAARSMPRLPDTILADPARPVAATAGDPIFVDAGPAPVEVTLPPPGSAIPAVDLSRGAAPRGAQGDWFPRDAYPAAARRAGAEGRVSVTVDVGTNGRVSACRVTASSGSDDLDAATCRLATRNGRFTPAQGADGRPVAASYPLRNVRWVLEE